MPKHLYIIRHAEAEPSSPDKLRPLTDRGREQSKHLGLFLRDRIDLASCRLVTSELVRAVETADLLVEHAGANPAVRQQLAGLEPYASCKTAVKLVAESDSDLILVGHNPHLESLVLELLGMDDPSLLRLKKGALIHLKHTNFDWRLTSLISPSWL